MARPRTGTAFRKHGVLVLSIRQRDGTRWTARCPNKPGGEPPDLRYAKNLVARLVEMYDAGKWDPEHSKNLPNLGTIDPTSDKDLLRTVVAAWEFGILTAEEAMQRLRDRIPKVVPELEAPRRFGGRTGGLARAKALTKERRVAIAKKAAKARWGTKKDLHEHKSRATVGSL